MVPVASDAVDVRIFGAVGSSKWAGFMRLPTNDNDDGDRLDGIWKRLGIVAKNGLRPLVRRECSCRGQHECGLSGSKQDTHVQAVSDELHSAE